MNSPFGSLNSPFGSLNPPFYRYLRQPRIHSLDLEFTLWELESALCVQEDAHDFVLQLLDGMASAMLNEFGGAKRFDQRTQETTLVHHIFGGYTRSQVGVTTAVL